LVDFVNAMTSQGLYTRDELLPKATQAFHADFYLAQVNNGGHGQFIHNSRDNIDYALADVQAALTVIQAEPYTSIGEWLIAWCQSHRDPVTGKIALKTREQPDGLDILEFYAADKASPFRSVLGRWIATWPELRPVDDADYPEALRVAASMNPLREARQQWKSVTRLRQQTTDRFLVGVGLACVKIERPELRVEIGAGQGVEIDGQKELAFHVHTNRGLNRFCVVKPDYAAAYEYIPADIPNAVLARAGAQLSRVSGLLIDDVIALAKKYRTGLAIDLLLRRAKIVPDKALVIAHAVVPSPDGDLVRWMLYAENHVMAVLNTPDGAALLPGESAQPIATVGVRDLNAHADLIGAGSMEANPL